MSDIHIEWEIATTPSLQPSGSCLDGLQIPQSDLDYSFEYMERMMADEVRTAVLRLPLSPCHEDDDVVPPCASSSSVADEDVILHHEDVVTAAAPQQEELLLTRCSRHLRHKATISDDDDCNIQKFFAKHARGFKGATHVSRRRIAAFAIGHVLYRELSQKKISDRWVLLSEVDSERKLAMMEHYFDLCKEHACSPHWRRAIEKEEKIYMQILYTRLGMTFKPATMQFPLEQKHIVVKINQHLRQAGLMCTQKGQNVMQQSEWVLELDLLYRMQPSFDEEGFLPKIVLDVPKQANK